MIKRRKMTDDEPLDAYSYDTYEGGAPLSRRRFPLGGLIAVLVVMASIAAVYFLVIAPALARAEKIADKLAEGIQFQFGFTPSIVVNERNYILETRPIAEMAVVQKGITVEYEYEKTVFFLPSRLELEGTYTVKAGFDLSDEFSIVIDDADPIAVTVHLSDPKILSTELVNYEVEADEGFLWSQITAEEREEGVNKMNAKAPLVAQEDGILTEARLLVEDAIRKILQEDDVVIKFQYAR